MPCAPWSGMDDRRPLAITTLLSSAAASAAFHMSETFTQALLLSLSFIHARIFTQYNLPQLLCLGKTTRQPINPPAKCLTSK